MPRIPSNWSFSAVIRKTSVRGSGDCCLVQFAGVAFILGMLFTVLQYRDLMKRSVGFRTSGLVMADLSGDMKLGRNVADAIWQGSLMWKL